MDKYPLSPDAQDLEAAFFARQDSELLEKLRKAAQLKQRRDAFREVVPNADDELLDRLMEMGLQPQTVLALVLVPLAAVAWADGRLEPRERQALLKAAEERGVKPGTPARQLLDTWLEHPPGTQLLDAWKRYVRTLYTGIEEKERRAVHSRILELARGVAQAAGGFLGMGAKISPAERAVLDEMEKALT